MQPFVSFFPQNGRQYGRYGHLLCVPFDVCRGILADSIVAKIFDGIGWLMQLLLGSILADATVAKKFEGIAWLMQLLHINLLDADNSDEWSLHENYDAEI